MASRQLLDRLQSLGAASGPFAQNLSQLLTSFRQTGGIERFMDFIFLSAGSTNGYDALGHFLRAEPVASPCVAYKIAKSGTCTANFVGSEGASARSARSASAGEPSTVMARTLAVLEGKTAAQALAEFPGAEGMPQPVAPIGSSRPAGGASAGTTYYKPGAEAPGASERLLEYLLGS